MISVKVCFFPLRAEKQLQKDKCSTLMKELSFPRMDIGIFHGPVGFNPKFHFGKSFI